jgi:hypothetical protein
MKQKYMFMAGMMVLGLALTMVVASCDKDSDTDPALDGTWVSGDGKLVLNQGDFEIFNEDYPALMGTYTTSSNEITMQLTHVNFFGTGLLTKAQIKSALESEIASLDPGNEEEALAIYNAMMTLASLEEMFLPRTGTYSLSSDGKTLIMTVFGEATTFTKK